MLRYVSGVPLCGLIISALLVIGPSPAAPGSFTSRAEHQIRQSGTVVRVIDGDTIAVRLSTGHVRRVRLVGIDTPEVYGGVRCGGPRASRSLRSILPTGTRVRLASDVSQANRDRWDRLLRYVTKASTGRDVNRTQVIRGWARVNVFNRRPFNRVSSYRVAQRAANRADRGVWGLCRPAPGGTTDTGSFAPSSTWNCPRSAPIKGNEPSMIYHPRSSPWYAATTPEQCFASEAGARAAGFRRASY
jgi:endonuclease YncB( thermonuclease family)